MLISAALPGTGHHHRASGVVAESAQPVVGPRHIDDTERGNKVTISNDPHALAAGRRVVQFATPFNRPRSRTKSARWLCALPQSEHRVATAYRSTVPPPR
jgi:hypothetical protein